MNLGKLAQMRNGTAPPLDSLTWLCLVGRIVDRMLLPYCKIMYIVLNMF